MTGINKFDGADLTGRVALVTGASGSIGAAVGRALADRGAAVAVHGRTENRLTALVQQIRESGGRATAHLGDVRDPEHLAELTKRVSADLGPIDIAVPLAGGAGAPEPSAAMSVQRWREVVDLDLTSTFLTLRAVLPGMVERGDGRIVTVASSAGRRASQANAAYAAAKAGVVMLTEHLAKEYAGNGIRVNCVAPSIVETDTLRHRMPAAQLAAIAGYVPLRRIGQPADIAETVAFLVSDAAGWITGNTIDITGGMTL
ncbi:SDR family NAD(P)-dependent oxidoreductase [Rhodococcus sp. NPDC055112]